MKRYLAGNTKQILVNITVENLINFPHNKLSVIPNFSAFCVSIISPQPELRCEVAISHRHGYRIARWYVHHGVCARAQVVLSGRADGRAALGECV